MADSAYDGFGLLKNVDIETYPGAVKAQRTTASQFHVALSSTFTADSTTDIITVAGGVVPITGTAVTVSNSGGALPAGLSAATIYFVIFISSTTFQLATTILNANANTAIDITNNGSGTNTVVTVNPGTIKYYAKDHRTTTLFAQDSNARVWVAEGSDAAQFLLLNGNTLTDGSGNGISLFLNSDSSATYLFAFRNAAIDVVNVFGTSNIENPSWSNSWKPMDGTGSGTNNPHYSIVGQDNIVYFTDGRFIGSILENLGQVFTPGNGATFNYNNHALDTPQTEILQWLEELGINLLAAGGTFNYIYPWDRVSSSFNLPLAVPEIGVKRLKNSGGIVYILAGGKGNIYTTQGTFVTKFRKIPGYAVDDGSSSAPVTWGGIALRTGNLLVGVGSSISANSGVYVVYPDGRILMDNIPSTGSGNATALFAENDLYHIGRANGADRVLGTGARYSGAQSIVQSKLYEVGDKIHPGTFVTLEMQLGRPSTGSAVVSWRPDTSSAFVDLATFNGDSVATSFTSDVALTGIENIQIQLTVNGAMEVMELRLFP
jgi:hypothetical protein